MTGKKECFAVTALMLVGSFSIALTLLPENVKGATLYVGGGGPGNYTSIQNAIMAATPGDTVFVFSGMYSEVLVVDKPISLVGEGKETTVIMGDGIDAVIHVKADWVNVTGFNMTNGGPGFFNDAIVLDRVSNCRITHNRMINLNGNGIYLHRSDFNVIAFNDIQINSYGLYLRNSESNSINNNNVSNGSSGISLSDSSPNNRIFSNKVHSNRWSGISAYKSNETTILNNEISFNQVAIVLLLSENNSIRFNDMIENGILMYGDSLGDWNSHIIDTTNTVNNKPVQYWKNVTGGKVPEGAGQVILANCSDILVENQNLSNATSGLQVAYSRGGAIKNNTAMGNRVYGIDILDYDHGSFDNNHASENLYDIRFRYSDNNTMANNSVVNQPGGGWFGINVLYSNGNEISGTNGSIVLGYSDHNTIVNGTSSGAIYGVLIASSENNTLAYNKYTDNLYGIHVVNAANNTVFGNRVAFSFWGIWLENSSNIWVYHNNIHDNTDPAQDDRTNFWDNGYPSGGNYWDRYMGPDQCSGPNQDVCPDPDGIGDIPYVIDLDSQDNYPLMAPPPDPFPPIVSISYPIEGQNFGYSHINVTGMASDTGCSGLRNIEVRLNGGPWWNATGAESWNTSLDLVPGSNTIEAQAWDHGGNPSEIAVVNVTLAIMPEPLYRPTASFTVSPASGNVSALFDVDASSSSDIEDTISALEVRWDWENDGVWDTGWSTGKTEQHQYANPGTYTIRLEVRDTDGLSDNTTRQVIVTPMENLPPLCSIIDPIAGETISGTYTITGEASDPDGTVQSVEIRIDNGAWVQATGTTNWNLTWDSNQVTDGEHRIYARSFDGTDYSSEVNVTVFVDNTPPLRPYDWTWIVILIIIGVLAVILLWIVARRRKKTEVEEPPGPPQEEPL